MSLYLQSLSTINLDVTQLHQVNTAGLAFCSVSMPAAAIFFKDYSFRPQVLSQLPTIRQSKTGIIAELPTTDAINRIDKRHRGAMIERTVPPAAVWHRQDDSSGVQQ